MTKYLTFFEQNFIEALIRFKYDVFDRTKSSLSGVIFTTVFLFELYKCDSSCYLWMSHERTKNPFNILVVRPVDTDSVDERETLFLSVKNYIFYPEEAL